MPRSLSIIGLSPDELPCIRSLVALLRHPDPTVPELTRQALLYLSRAAAKSPARRAPPAGTPPTGPMLNCMK